MPSGKARCARIPTWFETRPELGFLWVFSLLWDMIGLLSLEISPSSFEIDSKLGVVVRTLNPSTQPEAGRSLSSVTARLLASWYPECPTLLASSSKILPYFMKTEEVKPLALGVDSPECGLAVWWLSAS